jgi:hypothetical protein
MGLQVNRAYTVSVRSVNLNAVGDTAVHVPYAKYIARLVTTTNVSTTLAASSATLGVYTAAAAGGTAVVTAATASLTPLTAASKFKDCTIAASADSLTADTLYIRVGVVHGAPATCDVYLELQSLE